ncbi:hypothetical protein KC367_g4279 [Hortaea werneckii]|nr:hypothetical protein KC342_g17036 [Hortaea werneckii]KAI7071315.1 hypothetical protein KC339_g14471 [Hortaea werneckii]KAI7224666.1 hypothetical protein KC365_g10515 [Hortaea werneckii]KAI7292555.1 hypothetical protein KC340_g16728 [Hortaea werneckii]KAI7389097.1 hypothetical protein KC328_g8617 [Hortaea werneckii]
MTIIQQNGPAPESAIAAAYYEDLAPPAVQAISSEQGPQVFCSNGQHSKLAQQQHVGTLIEQPARGIDRSSILRRQSADSSRLTMHGVKRAFHDGEDRDSKRRDISVRDIDVNQHFFFVLTSSELDDEFKSSRAYQEEICAEYQRQGEGLKGTDWISSTKESQHLGRSGDIGIFAVAQFRANPSPPDDEVLDWWPHKEGILVIKLRPGLICENDWWGLRVRLFWGFGDSNPRLARVKSAEGVYQSKLADYVQVLLYPSSKVSPEPKCFAPPVYFHSTVRDYPWNKEERFMHVHNCYVYLHSSPYRIVGRLHGREDFQAHVALEKATASRLSASAEKALREFEQEVESGEESRFVSTTEHDLSSILGSPSESQVASTAEENISTESSMPSAEAQLLADEAEREAEREYTHSDPQGFGLGSLMSRARRFGVEGDASAPEFE